MLTNKLLAVDTGGEVIVLVLANMMMPSIIVPDRLRWDLLANKHSCSKAPMMILLDDDDTMI